MKDTKPNATNDTKIAVLENNTNHIFNTLNRIDTRLDKMEGTIKDSLKQIDGRLDKIDSKVDRYFFWLLSFGILSFGGLAGLILHLHKIIG